MKRIVSGIAIAALFSLNIPITAQTETTGDIKNINEYFTVPEECEKVILYEQGFKIAEDDAAPFEFSCGLLGVGSHNLKIEKIFSDEKTESEEKALTVLGEYMSFEKMCDFNTYKGGAGWYDGIQIVSGSSIAEKSQDTGGVRFSELSAEAYLRYDLQENDRFLWEFDVYFDDVPKSGWFMTMGKTAAGGVRYMQNIVIENGIMKFYNGTSAGAQMAVESGKKYHIEYGVDTKSKSYYAKINGESFAENFKLRNSDVIEFYQLRCGAGYGENAKGSFSLGNFAVKHYKAVPEITELDTDYYGEVPAGNALKFSLGTEELSTDSVELSDDAGERISIKTLKKDEDFWTAVLGEKLEKNKSYVLSVDFDGISAKKFFKTNSGAYMRYIGEETSGADFTFSGSVEKIKDNTVLRLDSGDFCSKKLKLGKKSVISLNLKKQSDGAVYLGDCELLDSGSIGSDRFERIIIYLDGDTASIFKDGTQISQKSIDDKSECVLKIIGENMQIDDVLLIPDLDYADDVSICAYDLYVGDETVPVCRTYAGENTIKAAVYDKRDNGDTKIFVAHFQSGKLVSLDSPDIVSDGNFKSFFWKKNIEYKRDDEIRVYIWDSLGNMIPLSEKCVYEKRMAAAPYENEIKAAYKKTDPVHPFIVADGAAFEKVRTEYRNMDGDAKLKGITDSCITEADKIVQADIESENSKYYVGYQDSNDYVLYAAGKVMEYAEKLGFAYQITGDTKYTDKLYLILERAGYNENTQKNDAFPNWNPDHFLGTAQMTAAFALAYDWGYDGFSQTQREKIENSIYRYGVSEGIDGYKNNAKWGTYKNNWGMICNSGIALGALVLMDKGYEDCAFVVAKSRENLEIVLDLFHEDGLWQESLGYGTTSLKSLINVTQSFENSMGNDFGLLSAKGFDKAADSCVYLDAPTGAFNFHDANPKYSHMNAAQMLWIAEKFGRDDIYAARFSALENYGLLPDVYDALWYNGEKTAEDMKKDHCFDVMQMFSMSENLYDTNALWLGAEGGKNNIDHCHLDCGNFVLDWGGYRWALDLGYDDYTLPGYFYTNRYNYYRVRAEGHNTLVINPGTGIDQKISADAKVEKFVSEEDHAFAIVDLTSAYDAEKVRRGFFMGDNRKSVTVRDELELNSADDVVYWYMHTDATVNIVGNKAYLQKGAKKMKLEFLAEDCDAVMDCVSAVPMYEIAGTEGQNKNSGIKKIRIKLTNGKSPKLSVKISPYGDGTSYSPISNDALDNW